MKKVWCVALLLAVSTSVWAAESGVGQSATGEAGNPSQRNFLFRVEPTWLILKELNLDFQFRISDNFTLGPTLSYMAGGSGVYYGTSISNRFFYNDTTNRTGVGLRGVYYLNGFQRHSPYVGVFGKYLMNQVSGKSGSSLFGSEVTAKGSFNETVTGVTGGYQWVWGRFVMNVGGGVAYFNHPDSFTMNYSDNTASSKYDISGSKISYAIDAGAGITF